MTGGFLGGRRLGGDQFTCAICQREANVNWWCRDGIAPICSYCETHQTPNPRPFGSFMDRRMARRLFAIAQAVDTEARHQIWGRKYHG
jgi:hypothetical protein